MSRLIIALCVIGCLYAAQAKPLDYEYGVEENGIEKPIERFEHRSFKELLEEIVRKLYTLRDSAWSKQKEEVSHQIIKLIKRADEKLREYNQNEKVEEMLKHTPYESLDSLTIKELIHEFEHRIEALFEAVWAKQGTAYKTYMIEYIKRIDEEIEKYNRIE